MLDSLNIQNERVNEILESIFDGRITPDQLPQDLYDATVASLSDGITRGMDFATDRGHIEFAGLRQHFEENIAIFSAAKTFQQVKIMSQAITDDSGSVVDFATFKGFAENIFDDFNTNYLRTEYNTAIATAQQATRWHEAQRDKDLFPYIKYLTVGDGRVRADHSELDGVTLPIDAPFWDVYFPPNGFNCRCTDEQLMKHEATPTKNPPTPDIPPTFAFNPGKGSAFFNSKHSYFAGTTKQQRKDNFGLEKKTAPPAPPKQKDIDAIIEKRITKISKAVKNYEGELPSETIKVVKEKRQIVRDAFNEKRAVPEAMEALDAARKAHKAALDRARAFTATLYQEKPLKLNKKVSATSKKNSPENMDKGIKAFEGLVGDIPELRARQVTIQVTKANRRAHFDDRARKTVQGTSSGPATFAHELGHFAEYTLPELNEIALAFRAKRVAGASPTRLKLLPGYKHLNANEKVLAPKKWLKPYTGKVYPRQGDIEPTEIVSMWFDHLTSDPITFIREDPKFFKTIYSYFLRRNLTK